MKEDIKFPYSLSLNLELANRIRYGENPHQAAGFYRESTLDCDTFPTVKQLQGKDLSYNNVVDADTALECVKQFVGKPACVIVKHASPCGVAIADNLTQAYEKAYLADSTSAFGGIIAFNKPLDAKTAKVIINQQFAEVIIAPIIENDAREILMCKSDIRVLECIKWSDKPQLELDFKRALGGLLVQSRDTNLIDVKDLEVVSKIEPSDKEMEDLLFAWKVVKFVKSNAIVYCKDLQTIGIGAGQTSRVHSAIIGANKASNEKFEIKGSVMASDAFFPFRDSIDIAAGYGISAIIQPGGSKNDYQVIAAVNENNIAMVFTGMRHFRH